MNSSGNRSIVELFKQDWRHPPNLVTLARMVGALALPPLVTSKNRKKKVAGAALFTTLAVTDKLDGHLAKNVYGCTDLGKMLDPAVDKELILVTLGSALAEAKQSGDKVLAGSITAALAALSVREIAVARIKLKAQRESHVVESAIQSGRVSMVAQSVAVGALLVPSTSPVVRKGKLVLLATAVGASLYSWADYRRTYRSKKA